MKNNNILIAVGIIIILLVAGCFIMSPNEQKTRETNPAKEIIDNAISKEYNIHDLTITIKKIHSVGTNELTANELLIRNGNAYYSNYSLDGAAIEHYLTENGTYYMCYDRIGKENRTCVDVTISPSLTSDIKNEFEQIPSSANLQSSKKYFDILFNTTAYKVLNIENETIGNYNTECVNLSIDFKSIAPADLVAMGLSPSDQFVLYSKNYTLKICYDSKTGYPMYSYISYELNGKKQMYENTVMEMKLSSNKITPPTANGTLDDVASFKKEIARLFVCTFSDERDDCLKNEAYQNNNPLYCRYVLNDIHRKGCLYYLTSYVADPRICDEFTNKNKDDCLDRMARENLRSDICQFIQNETKKENCTNYVNETITNIEEEKLANAECFTDADCHITGGLNQYCKPINIIRNDTKYYHVFECLPPHKNITTCKCVDYKCQWDWTPEYEKCFNEMDELDTKEYIEEIIKNKSKEQNNSNETSSAEYCIKNGTGYNMSYDEAKNIALNSECVTNATLTNNHICNNITGTWWIDLNMTEEKEGCNPACVIDIENKSAEINWRCTGLNE